MKYGSGKEVENFHLLHINISHAVSQKVRYYTALLSDHYSFQILGQITCGAGFGGTYFSVLFCHFLSKKEETSFSDKVILPLRKWKQTNKQKVPQKKTEIEV